jgi:hypothetical protein
MFHWQDELDDYINAQTNVLCSHDEKVRINITTLFLKKIQNAKFYMGHY